MIAEISLQDIQLIRRYQQFNRLKLFYPDAGPLRRELYTKHLEFFRAGAAHRERAAICANRVGKTEGIGAYEVTLHATGEYPDWWEGKRFSHAPSMWVCGKTNITTRDILQAKLLGKTWRERDDTSQTPMGLGTGLIPARAIANTRPKQAIPNAIESCWVKHKSGGRSTIVFKTYEQGRGSFEGTEQDLVWFDEEPPADVYTEGLMRTMATGNFAGGMCLLTFTPLQGWSEVVDMFLDADAAKKANRFCVQMGWDHAPHLTESEKAEMLSKLQPYEREARTQGIPRLGSGAIYPIEDAIIRVAEPFKIPDHWPRGYALDVGVHTAAIWAALDPDFDILYLYSEYFRDDSASIQIHADAIKARGEWIQGWIDPSANGRSQTDGQRLIELYRRAGLHLDNADNAVYAGIQDVWDRMTSNRLRVFGTLNRWWDEKRLYRRDEKGKIVKKKDHMMDASRYVTRMAHRFRTKPVAVVVHNDPLPVSRFGNNPGGGWMG